MYEYVEGYHELVNRQTFDYPKYINDKDGTLISPNKKQIA